MDRRRQHSFQAAIRAQVIRPMPALQGGGLALQDAAVHFVDDRFRIGSECYGPAIRGAAIDSRTHGKSFECVASSSKSRSFNVGRIATTQVTGGVLSAA